MIRSLHLFAIVFACFSLNLNAEIIQLRTEGTGTNPNATDSQVINLGENDYAELIGLGGEGAYLTLLIEETEYTSYLYHTSVGTYKIKGPAQLFLRVSTSPSIPVLFRVSRGSIPTDSIMVPNDDPTATFEVFMEASTDMETWVRVIPGDYDASGGAKFFRVRMVKK